MEAVQRKDRVRHTLQLGLQSTMAAIYQQLGSLLISPMLQYQGKEYTGHGLRYSMTQTNISYIHSLILRKLLDMFLIHCSMQMKRIIRST
jgi:hypothetical protein